MVNARRKGKVYEQTVGRWFRGRGHEVRRARGGEHQPDGDILGMDGWVIECKNRKNVSDAIRMAVDQAKGIAKGRWWVAIVKRPQKPVEDSYAIMDLQQWENLYRLVSAKTEGSDT